MYAPVTVNAVAAMSVVTSVACASTGGMVVNRKVAISPATGPPVRLPHRNTITQASRKNGSTPRRASASMRS